MAEQISLVTRLRRVVGAALRARAMRRELSRTQRRKREAEARFPPPTRPDRPIVLDVYVSQNLMHLAPLYRALKQRKHLPVFAALRDATNESRHRAIARGIESADILMGDALCRVNPALVIACDQAWEWLHPPVPNVPRAQIFHGCLLKSYSAAMADLAKFDHFLFPGPLYRSTFEACVTPYLAPSAVLHNTGMPRTDDILALNAIREESIHALGLNPTKKTVLYAPTWHVEATFIPWGEEIVRTISEMGLQCLVRPHPYALNPTIGRASRRAHAVLDACRGVPGVVLAHDKDDRHVMAAADVLVADYGSIAYEYLILDRPVVFFDAPEYRHLLRDDDLESWGRSAGKIVRDARELREAIRDGLDVPEATAAQRKQVLDRIYFNLGNASEACCDVLESIRG